MSLVALYDALKEANVSNDAARAAVEAVEEKQVHERLAAVEAKLNIHTGLLIAIMGLLIASIWI